MEDPETQTPHSERTPLIAPTTEQNEAAPKMGRSRILGIAVLMAILIFIQATNISMMTTAQSEIAADLDAYDSATWFTASYMIASSSITPLAGRLSAIFTPRLCLVFSSLILAIGLFITAIAPSLAVFILGRVVVGLGCGGFMSITIILALDLASPKRRGLIIGLISTGYTTGIALGAVLAGFLSAALGWRLIFWIQAPIALILAPLLFLAIPPPEDGSAAIQRDSVLASLARIDYAGALILTTAVVLSLTSLASPEVLIWPIPVSLALFVAFYFIESQWAQEPIIPVKVLSHRGVLLSSLAGMGMMMARWSVVFFTPSYAIAVRGWHPASAGLILIPTNAGFGLGGLLVGWLHIRKNGSYYISSIVIFTLFAIVTLGLGFLSSEDSPVALYLATTFFNGLFAGSLVNYTLSHVLYLTNPKLHYIVSALFTSFRGFAGSFGSGIGGGFFTRILKKALEDGFEQHGLPPKPDLVRTLLGSPATVGRLEGIEHIIAKQGFEHAFRMLFLAAFIVALASTVIQAGTGWTPESDGGDGDSESE